MRFAPATAILLLLTVPNPAAPASATVFRCTTDTGDVLFSDRPCAAGAHQRELPAPAAQHAGSVALDERSRETLREISRGNAERRATRARRLARTRRAAARQRQQRARRCAAISARLETLRAARRRGYRVRDARALDDEQRALRAEAREDC